MCTKTKIQVLLAMLATTAVGGLTVTACTRKDERRVTGTTETTGATVSGSWQTVTKDWPESSRSAAKEMTKRKT